VDRLRRDPDDRHLAWTPWYTLLLLAGLQSLPREPFEAAEIDGTSTLARIPPPYPAHAAAGDRGLRGDPRDRRLPHLRHRLDPDRWRAGRSTELFSLYAYVLAFLNLDLGRGSAAAIIGGLIILVVGACSIG
jgi:multiple sugar transport system permease protein